MKYDDLSVEINMVSIMPSSAKANFGVKLEPKIMNKKQKLLLLLSSHENKPSLNI